RGQKMTMPTTACTNVVRDGIEVDTRSEAVKKVRDGVQEFLLINHPLDCPECDKSGECRLQDYAFDFGRGYTRFEEKKVASHIKQLGPTIDFFGTRCIQCSRCIRFSDEVSGTHELCFVNRGDRTTVDTFPGEPIDNGLDLNVVELCPVGALKNHDFLYQSRVWSLEEKESVCNLCARGCAVRYDSLKGVVKRVMAAENTSVNDYWACNHARLNFEWVNRLDRLMQPKAKNGDDLAWSDAYVSISERLKSHLDNNPQGLGLVVNASQTIEELFLLKQLFGETLRAGALAGIALPDEAWDESYPKFKQSADRNPNRKGLELVFGISDADASVKELVTKLKGGQVKTLFLVSNAWNGFVPDELVNALENADYVIGLGIFDDNVARKCDIILAGRTHAEKDGSFINEDWHLQAFRRAVPEVAGLPDTEILQELLDRVAPDASGRRNLSVAALFNRAAQAFPQLSGYTHNTLRQKGGARLI
ncbi:MAG: molybdopterin-dependent oxidoreductase, partial [Planctomycetes bacterium]|nr:molybdopterin-dependent oxidoreductase [Planctomycetota bacterium]